MYRDTMDTIYALGGDATPRVQRGDTVAAGDVIASGFGPAAIVPYAALLHLSADAAVEAVVRHDGATYSVGTSLGARRIGLFTHSVAAPASGKACGLPQSGALAIKDETKTCDYRAQYAGTVQESSQQAIVITSDVVRWMYAFTDRLHGARVLHIEEALLRAASADETVTRLPREASSTVIAHISNADHLTAVVRSFGGTLFVGSVTDTVAWALWERSLLPAIRHRKGPDVVVLDGVGNAEDGVRAVAPFRSLDGATAIIDRFTQTIMVMPSRGVVVDDEIFPASDLRHHGQRRDPANYRSPCNAVGAPAIAVTSGGTRALCMTAIGETAGGERVPLQNLQPLRVAGD